MSTELLSGLVNNNEGITSLNLIKYESGIFSAVETPLGRSLAGIADRDIFNNLFTDLVSDYIEQRINQIESNPS